MVDETQKGKSAQPPQAKRNITDQISPGGQLQQTIESEDLQALPTKQDMADMLSQLELMIKGEINATRRDIQNVPQKVEDTEIYLDEHKEAIMELRERAEMGWIEVRNIQYKLEDQENRSRRKNLRVRGLPETVKDAELEDVLWEVFIKALKREASMPLLFERFHRTQKMKKVAGDLPRDVIARFHHYDMKEQVSQSTRNSISMDYMANKLLIFTDLSPETLARRRALKPLISHLQENNISYRWGFPDCLIAKNQRVSVTLRFPEDIKEFCNKLGLPFIKLENWEKRPPT